MDRASQRKQPLTPFKEDEVAEAKTLDLLESALLPSGRPPVSDVVQERLRQTAARDMQELLPHLEQRGQRTGNEGPRRPGPTWRTGGHRHDEDPGGAEEARGGDRREVPSDPQLLLSSTTEEERQLESNQRHWEKRLTPSTANWPTEPDRIRGLYEVKAQRIEPVGLVYLWPVTG